MADVGVACGEEGGDEALAACGQQVAIGLLNAIDDSVGAENAE